MRRADLVNAAIEKLVTCFYEPFVLGEHKFPTRVSVGVAMSPSDATDASTLLKRARTALDGDSKAVTSRYKLYNRQLSKQAVRRFQIESALGEAAARNELALAFQPKVRCGDCGIVGAEALLRWTSDTLGHVSPAEFVPIAEESGLIVELGTWALTAACKQIAAWSRAGYSCPEVSVNVSGDQLTSQSFCDQIRAILRNRTNSTLKSPRDL